MEALGVLSILVGIFGVGVIFGREFIPDIREHTKKPYCEERSVAGKSFKHCLIAVEPMDANMPPEAPSGEIVE